WVWQAQLDSRTCPSCWAQHGSVHDLSETGPNDHQQGRCARVPKTKSWRDLGFSVREPADLMPDAQTAFRAMSKADQLAVMGPVRLHALNAGVLPWSALSMKVTTKGWRDSYAATPVKVARRALVKAAR